MVASVFCWSSNITSRPLLIKSWILMPRCHSNSASAANSCAPVSCWFYLNLMTPKLRCSEMGELVQIMLATRCLETSTITTTLYFILYVHAQQKSYCKEYPPWILECGWYLKEPDPAWCLAAFTLYPFDICLLRQKDSLIMAILPAISAFCWWPAQPTRSTMLT